VNNYLIPSSHEWLPCAGIPPTKGRSTLPTGTFKGMVAVRTSGFNVMHIPSIGPKGHLQDANDPCDREWFN
jgi:hypothetical protein